MTIYYVDGAVGNNANSGLAEGAGNAWADPAYAATQIANGDIVYIKSSVTYTTPIIQTATATFTAYRYFIGYDVTPGDNGLVTIDATGNNYGVSHSTLGYNYYVYANIEVINATTYGFYGSNAQYVQFINCHASSAGNGGFYFGNQCFWVLSTVENCGTYGMRAAGYGRAVCNRLVNNGGTSGVGLSLGLYGMAAFNVVDGNYLSGIQASSLMVGLNNTINIDPQTNGQGINTGNAAVLLNNIVRFTGAGTNTQAYDFGNASQADASIALNNLWEGAAVHIPDSPNNPLLGSNHVNSDPLFIDEAALNFRIGTDSPAYQTGTTIP